MTLFFRFSFLFIFSVVSHACFSQGLSFYGDVMLSAREANNRVYAADRFLSLTKEKLDQAGSFDVTFDDVRGMSKVYAPDSSYRMLTWQIDKGDGKFDYYGVYQSHEGTYQLLNTKTGDKAIDSEGIVEWTSWSGALVYDLFVLDGTTYIFTFRQLDQYTKVKTCEVLSVSDSGVQLGKSTFPTKSGNLHNSRLVLQYASDANAKLSYESQSQRIIYDNLATVMGRLEGQGPTQVPDGTFRVLEYQDAKWSAIDNLYENTERMRPNNQRAQTKKTQQGKKDIFGRKRKRSKR